MTDPSFLANIWAEAAREYALNLDSVILGVDRPHRAGHRLPVTPEQQAKFDAWQTTYDAICQQGEDEEWLTYTYDDGPVVEEPKGEWVYDEPEAEYEKRRQAWLDKIAPNGTIPIWRGDRL